MVLEYEEIVAGLPYARGGRLYLAGRYESC